MNESEAHHIVVKVSTKVRDNRFIDFLGKVGDSHEKGPYFLFQRIQRIDH